MKLSEEIDKLKEEFSKYKIKLERQEDAIFNLARYGRSNKGLFMNILNTDSSKSKLVSEALNGVSNDYKIYNNEIEGPDNVVDLVEKKNILPKHTLYNH
ncbi:hypothetical protein [Bacillus sp. PS06]|uniref:hypothetical protein n=1 Tax=Bacillus sp. PS06 TaxID=2764176 RepID=UPI001784B7E4|nr:hypothetical protein [Bacillus sp. PS06]MBD8069285.1 hypothetical protein [Bacillus sp. PS06]